MPSDDESRTDDVVSERESHFVPRSDDDEVLWTVQEITAERGKQYRVKWAGTDPATGKPWAQSWVAKHDCTDDLVVEWKAKKKRLAEGKKRGGRTSTASRASGSAKRAVTGSSTSGKRTRPPTSEATSSRLDSVQEHLSPLPSKKSTTKRKRRSETPATMTTTTSGAGQADEESELSRPRKKHKTMLERLFPPISSDDEADDLLGPDATQAKEVPLQSAGASLDGSEERDDRSPPKAKGKSVRSKGAAVGSKTSKTKVVSRRKERVADVDAVSAVSSQDEQPRQLESKKKVSKHKSPSERNADLPEKEVASVAPIKIGPPRDVKRREVLGKSGSSSKPGPSRARSREDDSGDGRKESKGRPGEKVSAFGKSFLLGQDRDDNPTSASPLPRISIPQALPSARPRTPDLSPGTKARLEMFDQMTTGAPQPDAAPSPADVSEHVPDDTHFDNDDIHDTHDAFDAFDAFDPPRPLSPPPSKSKPKHSKLGTPNGLIVPETESSGNSQSQLESLPKLPPPPQPPPVRESPRKSINLPSIAVIAASATSSSLSPQDLFPLPPKPLPSANRPSKWPTVKPVLHISPNTFRATINARSHVADSEAPPSSIESFASPKRVDKGKQRAVEEDRLSEGEEDDQRQKRPTQKKITDSALKKRGMEIFNQIQLAREAQRQKKKKPKRLKAVDDIVNRRVSSLSKGSPLPSTSGAEGTLEMRWEDVIDLNGGANGATLDSGEHSQAKPLSEEERERLRFELREEEEENTQEAMGAYPPLPVKESNAMNSEDAQMPPPRSPEHSLSSARIEDIDHVEQPSTDLQQASVIVQPSQGQQHEDMDVDPLPADRPASSPPRPIPENLTDSPRRRLGEALSLLNVKSEEIQRLERELADERENLQGLKVKLADIQQPSEPTAPVLAAWEAERAQWTQERSKWENDVATWETRRKEWSDDKASLSDRVAELLHAKARAEEVSAKLSELEAERVAWTKERDVLLSDITQRSEELAALTKARGEDDQHRLKWEAERASWVEERAKWETERVALQEKQETSPHSVDELMADLTKAREEDDQNRLKWEAERVSWVEEKARWETERAALQEKQEASSRSVDELTASVASLTSAKVSVEKDRDFFREQYTQASGFASSVRDENIELEKRVTIAEGQAQEGVAGIKALYEGRIKTLQADVGRWKGLTELLQEKDRRTNDELRLRAAQVPELGDRCGRLTAENKSLEADVRKLGQAQQRGIVQRHKLYYEILLLKKERASLRSKLSKRAKMADSSSTQETSHSAPAPPVLEDPNSVDPNDMEMLPDPISQSLDEAALFPCLWRPQWRDQCQHVFDAKEDLERHVETHFRDLSSE